MTKPSRILHTMVLGAGLLIGCGDDGTSTTTTATSASSSSGEGGSASSTSGAGGAGGAGQGGGAPAVDWSCLGMVKPVTPSQPMADVTLILGLHPDMAPASGVGVKACAKADTMCTAPLSQSMSDSKGMVKLTVPTGAAGFDGYLELTSPLIVPSVIFLYPVITQSVSGIPFSLLSPTTLPTGLMDVGAMNDPTRGHVAMAALDCSLAALVPGVSIAVDSADSKSTTAYVKPDMGLDEKATATGEAGVGIIFNVPPGPAKMTGKLEATIQDVGAVDIFVRAGTITYASLPPTPKP